MTLPFPRSSPGPALHFAVASADHDPYAMGPTLRLHTRITDATATTVHTIALRTQVRIEPQKRRYDEAEQRRLVELFGEPGDWARSCRPMQLATVTTLVGSFTGETTVDVEVPLTHDVEIATTRYFRGLERGEVPLVLLFSGTVFYRSPQGVQVGLVPWHEEATYRLPVAVWRDMAAAHHAGTGWLTLPAHTMDRLTAFRAAHALPSWEQTVDELLRRAEGSS
ncbi:DUF6084 family protein [Actinomycetospora sp. TBRC 11914]|uniref:DUF6084 family protein n=1 Tax=Actinomycetospora sp. TBRC 11914 TaxID=2729387 RepID=UPI00145F47C2|nr:DUF6084 family protein [Actinomycetospora sp. TBRC 11914]NMO91318.1 hypothetical protein [Actinomycetospora sp. TBRC 11914]